MEICRRIANLYCLHPGRPVFFYEETFGEYVVITLCQHNGLGLKSEYNSFLKTLFCFAVQAQENFKSETSNYRGFFLI